MKKILYILLLAGILTSCGGDKKDDKTSLSTQTQYVPTPEDQLILQIQNTDRFYTTEYVVKKIVTYDDIVRLHGSVLNKHFDIRLPQGDRKVLIPMEARIKAYIDFKGFNKNNIIVSADSTVTVLLPDPTVVLTSTKIDHAGIRSYVDFGRSRFSNTELAEYERQGRAAIIASIPRMGIVETARMHAYNFIVPMLESLGYSRDRITVNFSQSYTDEDYLNKLIRLD